jgi:hypothetical protein
MPRKWGGLGIKDLEKFSKALRLKWLWLLWDPQDRPGKHLLKVKDPIDRSLFFSSTYMQVGDGKITPFWEARWLHETAPKDIAPNLFKAARFKSRSIATELHNSNWIRNIGPINSPSLLNEYVLLFIMLSSVTLTQDRDQVFWRWSANGWYSVGSAYECQFAGSMSYFLAMEIWRAKAEPKCKFFVWLAMHNKMLTTDNMVKKNWECNLICSFCFCLPETANHLLTQYNYTEVLWQSFATYHGLPSYDELVVEGGPVDWVRLFISSFSKTERKKFGLLFMFRWHVWKERNRRTFDNKELSVLSLMIRLNEAADKYESAGLH